MDDFLRPFSFSLDDQVTDAAVRLLAGAGMPRLSIAVVAAGVGMRRQSLTERLKVEIEERRSESPPAIYLHEMIVGRFGQRFRAWSTAGFFRAAEGLPPRLAVPGTPEERSVVRIWLALRELARSDWADGEPSTADEVAASDRELRNALRIAVQMWSGQRFSYTAASRLMALADGVQIATVSPAAPMSSAIARSILEREMLRVAATDATTSFPAA